MEGRCDLYLSMTTEPFSKGSLLTSGLRGLRIFPFGFLGVSIFLGGRWAFLLLGWGPKWLSALRFGMR